MMFVVVLAVCLMAIPAIAGAESDPVFISISDKMDKVIFDGKWTTQTEWKSSSWTELKFDNFTMQLRTAHQGDFVYVFLDAIDDTTSDQSDSAMLCIDNKNTTTDFCFRAIQGSIAGEVMQSSESGFVTIPSPAGLVAVGNVSDENDRYSAIPHASYEFRIPTDVIGRSDNYGFFVSVFDKSTQMYFNWPTNATRTPDIPPQNLWGKLVSPDKSLPEFDLPLLILLPSLALVFYFTRRSKA